MYEKERKRQNVIEILKLAGCLDNIDNDVADLCLKVMPKGKDKLISIADLMSGVQKIKNKLKKSLSTLDTSKELNSSSKKDCSNIKRYYTDNDCNHRSNESKIKEYKRSPS